MGCAVWVWLRQGLDKDWLQCAGWDWMRFTSGPATTTLSCVDARIHPMPPLASRWDR